MTGDPIQPNGKAELNKALPKDQGGHVLMLREQHDLESHLKYLTEHLDELKTEHHVGTLGFEKPPYFMPLVWNYRDTPAGSAEKQAARELLENSLLLTVDPKFKKTLEARISLIFAAVDKGIDVVFFDSRDGLREFETQIIDLETKADISKRNLESEKEKSDPHIVIYETVIENNAYVSKRAFPIRKNSRN